MAVYGGQVGIILSAKLSSIAPSLSVIDKNVFPDQS